MENTSLKFGRSGLSRTGGRETLVKATENKKWMVTKKNTNPAKRWPVGGSTDRPLPEGSESRPLDHRYLRKGLDDCKRTALVLYRNLVSTEVSTNNNKTVLLNVLLYCPGSTLPGKA